MKKEMPKVGKNTKIHHSSVIYAGVEIGDNCEIGPLCIIGANAEFNDDKYLDYECKGVIIEDGVKITGMVTIDAGRENPTRIGSGTMIMKGCHVGHDANISIDVTLSPGAKIGGFAKIAFDSNIGMNAVVHQRTSIPARCMIGMGAVVTVKAADQMKHSETWAGNPATKRGMNKKYFNKTLTHKDLQ